MGIITGSFTATGQSQGLQVADHYNVTVWGTFVGTVVLERSFDGGVTYQPLTRDLAGAIAALTAPFSMIAFEPERVSNVKTRLNCTAYVSGTINYRISQ